MSARKLSHVDRLHLVNAISAMTTRYGQAEREWAWACSGTYEPATQAEDVAESTQAFRRVWRRRAALDRLVHALAEVTA